MESNSRKDKTKMNILFGLLYRFVSLLLPFFVRTFLIEYLGAECAGVSSLFSSILHVLNLAELGFSSAVVFNLYKPIADNNTDEVCAILNFYRRIYNYIGIGIFFAGILVIPMLPVLIKGDIPDGLNLNFLYVLYLINTSVSYCLFAYKNSLLIALQRNDIISKVQITIVIVQCLVQILVIKLFKSFYLYVGVMIVFTVVTNLFVECICRIKFPFYCCKGTVCSSFKSSIKKQVPGIMLERISDTSRNALDNIVISTILGLFWVTVYSNYFYIFSSVYAIMLIVSNSIAPSVGDSIASETVEKNYQDFMLFDFMYSWIIVIASVCLFCLYQPFMTIWMGNDYLLPLFDVGMLVLYFFLLNIGNIRNLYFTGNGLWWRLKKFYVIEALSNLLLNISLGYFWGITGVLIATNVTILVFNFLPRSIIVFRLYFHKDITPFLLNTLRTFFVCLACCLITVKVCGCISIDDIPGFVVKMFVSMLIPFGILLCLNYKSRYFKKSMMFIIHLVK